MSGELETSTRAKKWSRARTVLVLTLVVDGVLTDDDGSGVSDIAHEEVLAVGEDTDTCRAAVAHIDPHVTDFFVGLREALGYGRMYLAQLWVSLVVVCFQRLGKIGLNEHRQAVLQEGAYVTSVRAMAVAHGEEMAVLEAQDVRVGDIGVLVYLVRVVGRDTTFRSEGELRDDVEYLIRASRLAFLRAFIFESRTWFLACHCRHLLNRRL